MIAMIFEYWMNEDDDVGSDYTETSTRMRELVAEIDGFREVERFESTADPGKYVTIGFFDDEEAVTRWRTLPEHRKAQTLGRSRFFTNYRLRMAEVVRDYGPDQRGQAPADSNEYHTSHV